MVTVAIIGCGKYTGGKEGFGVAYAHADGWQKLGGVTLWGVDVNAENLANFGEHYGLADAQLFNSTEALYDAHTPDFVSVCTWPGLHADMVVEAAERGVKGIACEKPMALTTADIQRMEKSCKDKGVALCIAHQRRYNPFFERAKTLLAQGRLGAPHVLEARVGDNWDILSWTTHWFDLANYLFGAAPEWVLAGAEVTGERRYNHDVENASVVLAQYPERQQALFVTGPANPQPHPITVRGSEGVLLLSEAQPAQLYTRDGFEEIVPGAVTKGEFGEDDYMSGFTFFLRDLVEAAQRGERSRCDVSVCAAATEVALAAHESARTNQRVALPLSVKFTPLEVLNKTAKPLAHGLRALVYADDHFGSGGRNGLRAALGAITGQPPVMLDAAAHALSEDDLAATDLICLYHTQEDALGATKEALTNWVEAGKPLLLVHAALGAYPAWDAYKRWLGYVWKWGSSSHPHEPAPLFTAEGDPLNFGWARAWLPKDEVYVDLERLAETLDGVYTELSTGQFPVAWTSVAYPNIGAWMPGHREDSWRSPTMRQGVGLLIAQMLKRSRLGS